MENFHFPAGCMNHICVYWVENLRVYNFIITVGDTVRPPTTTIFVLLLAFHFFNYHHDGIPPPPQLTILSH